METFNPSFGLETYLLCQGAALGVVWIYCSFAEWLLHRFIMHTKFIPRFPFNAHALVHHGLFRADDTFHASTSEQMAHVTFKWTDHVILNGVHLAAFAALELLTGLPVVLGSTLGLASYLTVYEAIHYAFHVPKNRFIEGFQWFQWLKHHHFIHHKRHFRNLNVVLPLADYVLGTRDR